MTEKQFRKKAKDYGYSEKDIEEMIYDNREICKGKGDPIPFDEIPLIKIEREYYIDNNGHLVEKY